MFFRLCNYEIHDEIIQKKSAGKYVYSEANSMVRVFTVLEVSTQGTFCAEREDSDCTRMHKLMTVF
jgi:hypothetical protein